MAKVEQRRAEVDFQTRALYNIRIVVVLGNINTSLEVIKTEIQLN